MLLCDKRSTIGGRCTSRKAIHGRSIYNSNFVCVIQETAGNSALGACAGDEFHLIAEFFEIL